MRNSQKKNVDNFQRNARGGNPVFQNEANFSPILIGDGQRSSLENPLEKTSEPGLQPVEENPLCV